MLALLIGGGAFILLLVEMSRPPLETAHPLWLRITRFLPFAIVSILSLVAASRAPHGRKPIQVDLSLARVDLARSMTKIPHLRSIAVIFLLAALAFGTQRLIVAFAATMLVGVGWEIGETTVIGHYARLADLAPNLVAGVVCLAVIAGVRWILRRSRVLAE
jgi:hypothetical protein